MSDEDAEVEGGDESAAFLPRRRERDGGWECSERPGAVDRGFSQVRRAAYADGYRVGFAGPRPGREIRQPRNLPQALRQAWIEGCDAGARVRAEGLGLAPKSTPLPRFTRAEVAALRAG